MENKFKLILKNEKGAVSLLVFITILTFAVILLGAYLTVTTMRKSQLQSNIRLQQIYGEDVKRVNQIYDELTSKDREGPLCNITYAKNEEGSILYKFEFNEAVKDFDENDIKLYSGNILENRIADTVTLSTSSPAYSFNVAQNKKYIISFDYRCITDSQEFEIGLYSDTVSNLPTKKLTAKSEVEHEDYIIEVENIDTQFKILAQVQESNNVTLSNVQIIEITNEEIEVIEFEKINSSSYTLKVQYNENLKYAIILEENICTDLNGNKNESKIQII